jgi:hypothetical protein
MPLWEAVEGAGELQVVLQRLLDEVRQQQQPGTAGTPFSSSIPGSSVDEPRLLRRLKGVAGCVAQMVQEGFAHYLMRHQLATLAPLARAVAAVLPLPALCCSNPACANLSGLCEMHLVHGRGMCGHCGGAARWCSRACQRQQWAAHRDPAAAVAAAEDAVACMWQLRNKAHQLM